MSAPMWTDSKGGPYERRRTEGHRDPRGGAAVPGSRSCAGEPSEGQGPLHQGLRRLPRADGEGRRSGGRRAQPKPADFTNKAYIAGLKDQYLFDVVQKGGPAVGKSPLMAPFGSKLKEGEIWDVIAYVKSLAK